MNENQKGAGGLLFFCRFEKHPDLSGDREVIQLKIFKRTFCTGSIHVVYDFGLVA